MEKLKDMLEKEGLKVNKIDYIPVKDTIAMVVGRDRVIDYQNLRAMEDDFAKRLGKNLMLVPKLNIKEGLSEIFDQYKKNIELMLFDNCTVVEKMRGKPNISFKDGEICVKIENKILCQSLIKTGVDRVIKERIAFELGEEVRVSFVDEEKEEKLVAFQEKIASNINELSEDIAQKQIVIQKEKKAKEAKSGSKKAITDEDAIYGKSFKDEAVDIGTVTDIGANIVVAGEVFLSDKREITIKPKPEYKNQEEKKKVLHTFTITDYTGSISCKIFADTGEDLVKKGDYIVVKGDVAMDNYAKELTLSARGVCKGVKPIRTDDAKEKRVELHCHTNMSEMDAINSVKDIVKMAKDFGHKAIAITDHGVVQAFPDAMDAGKKHGVKILYGVEGYLVDDEKTIIPLGCEGDFDQSFVVFDIETTGLSSKFDKITEIGAVRVENGQIVGTYSQLVNPQRSIPAKITELTGIDDFMVRDKPTIDKVLPEFFDFAKDSILVAHNSDFDTGFLKVAAEILDIEYKFMAIDTVSLARVLYPKLKNHKLATLVKQFAIKLENHHRATDDATATANIFLKFVGDIINMGATNLAEAREVLGIPDVKSIRSNHISILAKNQEGIKDLYKLISKAHIEFFYKKPLIPKSILRNMKKNLIIGTACENGELFSAVFKGFPKNDIVRIAKFYDYIEIMPIENNIFMIDKGLVNNSEDLRNLNRTLLSLGKELNIPVVATGDVHYLLPHEGKYRAILQYGMKYKDVSEESYFYYKTTDEMLEDFAYLGEKDAYDVVVKNTNLIADMIDVVEPVPSGTFPPIIEGSDTELREMCVNKAISIYGEPLPEIVNARLERELKSIIGNGYAVMYIIAQRLVKDSLDHGFLVGSRGSVGSSFAATMSDITEVNPLCPHYICDNCKYVEFFENGEYGSGPDMPDSICPKCNEPLRKEGFEIPFEVFLGFEGDKEPDIDLNFAGDYQANAHRYTGVLLGEKNTFKAGTIGTIADKTAFGFVMKYLEQTEQNPTKAEIERLRDGCTGIKRSTGQHPGGVMVVPDYKEVYDFTPIQYPANDPTSGVITTHFDYHSISGRILKLDILGHDVPSMIRMLEDFTGVVGTNVPLDDKDTMSLFTTFEKLNCDLSPINCVTGSLGIPEFGTRFVRQMLMDTMPTTFAELLRISGLSHGTDVWVNNAQDLVRAGVTTLKDVISTRDDIMVYLMHKGLPPKTSFKIMENVRKGKGLTQEHIDEMEKNNVPQWYIDSCQKIKYMFPKAHAVAYVTMSYRIAYFKLYHKEAYYATFFTTKTDDFDVALISRGADAVLNKIKEIEKLGNDATTKEKSQLSVLESAYEMYARGVEMLNVDVYKSHPRKFLLQDNKLLPPLISVQGLGETVALKINEESTREFISLEDFRTRTKASKTVVETLLSANCLRGLPETNQLSLF